MCQCRHFVSDAHMRSPVVVEVYVPSYNISCLLQTVECCSRIDTFSLYYAVGSFGYGIVGRIGVFSHTDTDMGVTIGNVSEIASNNTQHSKQKNKQKQIY